MGEVRGMATCKVCGRDFALMFEEHYVVCDPKKRGVIVAVVDTDKEYEYDAFDCPHCGCQFIAQERKPKVSNTETLLEYDFSDGHGCEFCKYELYKDTEYPCKDCMHCNDDAVECKYERREEYGTEKTTG